tara:strand:+ start:259 stop:498 length:240 start_codon:yes stop_codon:yes gene_type:complete
MNALIYGILDKVLNVTHILVFFGLFVFFAFGIESGGNIFQILGITLGAFILYVLSVGGLVTLISIDNALQRIELQLKKK